MTVNNWRAGSSRRVLVADDNEINQLVFQFALEDAGFEVRVVADGRQALDIACREQPPFIVMDITMPVLDGYEAIMEIRRFGLSSGYKPFILAATAQALRSDRQRSIDAGADDYLAKPVSPDELVAMLEAAARKLT